MKKYILALGFLLIASNGWCVPNNTMSITPSASDATVIEASDVNTRSNSISTPYNAHSHDDITQTGNTLKLGDGTAGNKTIQANNDDTNKPFIRWDDTNKRWVVSRDGTNIDSVVTLSGANSSEFTFPENPSNNEVFTYSSSLGKWTSRTVLSAADADLDTAIEVEKNSDEDIVRIKTNGVERWTMSASGERVMPTQPAFQVTNSGTQSNIAVGSAIAVVLNSEIIDQGENFAPNTFTAPVVGNYNLTASLILNTVDSASTSYALNIITSNRTYNSLFDPRQFAGDPDRWPIILSVLADMDASDTASVQINQASGAEQTDILGGGAKFSGWLAN